MEGTTSGRITSNMPFSHNLPKVGDIVQQVKGGGYTGYVREVNLENEYVKIKWYKGTDNVFEDYQFFKYGPWNGTDSAIKVITNPVPREWWPVGNEWLFINLDIWRDHHHLTELEMIEAVHESGGPLAFAIEKDIYQIHRWTPPNRMPTHAEYAAGARDPDIYEDDGRMDIQEVDINRFPVGEQVAVDSYEHQLNGTVVDNSNYPETVDVEFHHIIWSVNYQDLYRFVIRGNHIPMHSLLEPGTRLYAQTTRDQRVSCFVVDKEDEDNFIVYFSHVTISVAIDLLITE